MVSVTQRIREVRQPRGGYLPAKDFSKIELDDGVNLYSQENVHPSLIGLSVDYLSRFMNGSPKERAFAISLRGAETCEVYNSKNKWYYLTPKKFQ